MAQSQSHMRKFQECEESVSNKVVGIINTIDAGQSPTFSPPGCVPSCLRPANGSIGSPASN